MYSSTLLSSYYVPESIAWAIRKCTYTSSVQGLTTESNQPDFDPMTLAINISRGSFLWGEQWC